MRPTLSGVAALNASALGHATRLDYHQRLLTDPHRMVAHLKALEYLVKPGMVVLDAGAGTGVLAMLAARAGAKKVYAVESMPVAALARQLVADNGLSDRVEVIEADLRTLPVQEPVDLIVSDCLGRFLYDDQMLEAMAAAFRWLKPAALVAPRTVELLVAPVHAGHLPLVDAFERPILGLELSRLGEELRHETWGGAFAASAVLSTPRVVARWDLPGEAPRVAFEGSFPLSAGRLVGLAGWFRATLADGVVLETAPGIETHWHQVFWPMPAHTVTASDVLEVTLGLTSLVGASGEPSWAFSGRVVGSTGDIGIRAAVGIVDIEVEGQDGEALDAEGARRFEEGDVAGAREYFERAALAPGRRDVDHWDNLGIARFMAGDYALAVMPLLKVVSEEPDREQSSRLLVSAAFLSGRQADGARWLADYERRFGPHPAGWSR